jgi:hypothetical protein
VKPRSILVCAFALVASLGCGDSTPSGSASSATPTSTAVKTAAPSTTPTATAAPSGSAGEGRGKMIHCPSTVDGATTDIQDVEGGVVVTVVTKDKDEAKTKEIRERAKYLVDASKSEAASSQHNGSGAGGGALGRCPIINRNTTVEAADVDGGSKVTVKPKKADEVDWVRRESRERMKEIGEPGAKEAGQNHMAHCPSSVEGAVTEVKASKDAVIVTVTAKDEAKTKEIRSRTTALLESAKKDPSTVEHKGDGSGGGGFGRCPVVLKDTTVSAKEVAGGSEVTVKPQKAAELGALEKEAKERAEKLAGKVPTK